MNVNVTVHVLWEGMWNIYENRKSDAIFILSSSHQEERTLVKHHVGFYLLRRGQF